MVVNFILKLYKDFDWLISIDCYNFNTKSAIPKILDWVRWRPDYGVGSLDFF